VLFSYGNTMKISDNRVVVAKTISPANQNGGRNSAPDKRNQRTVPAQNASPHPGQRASPPQSAQQLALLDEIKEVQPRAVRKKRVAIAPDVSVRIIPARVPKNRRTKRSDPSQQSALLVRPADTEATAGQTDNQRNQAKKPVRRPSI
jgi:hypothetical protein